MSEEIEVKFLDIDKTQLEKQLVDLGAKKVGDWLYRRQVFDYPDLRLDKQGAWLRLRDEGDAVRLCFKQRVGWKPGSNQGDDDGMQEIEIVVEDFNKTAQLIRELGLVDKFYFENRRTRYVKDGVEFDIDEWPLINPYLEIESDSWDKVDEAISWLGLNKDDAKKFSTTQIYALAGINDKDYIRLTFNEAIKRDE